MITYRIRQWHQKFETNETRKLKRLAWVPVPNKHEGKGWGRLTLQERRVELFCAWNLILQIGSKMPKRGLLADEDGPLSPEDMGFKTGFPGEIFKIALPFFTNIGWLEAANNGKVQENLLGSQQDPGEVAGVPAKSGAELNRTELKSKTKEPPVGGSFFIGKGKGQKIDRNFYDLIVSKCNNDYSLANRVFYYTREKDDPKAYIIHGFGDGTIVTNALAMESTPEMQEWISRVIYNGK
jgi:hypothetical protein